MAVLIFDFLMTSHVEDFSCARWPLAVGISDMFLPGGIWEVFMEEVEEAPQEKSAWKTPMVEEDGTETLKQQCLGKGEELGVAWRVRLHVPQNRLLLEAETGNW